MERVALQLLTKYSAQPGLPDLVNIYMDFSLGKEIGPCWRSAGELSSYAGSIGSWAPSGIAGGRAGHATKTSANASVGTASAPVARRLFFFFF